VKAGPVEIRPAEELTEMIRESEQRRLKTKTDKPEKREDRNVA
jgi:hypothetical protein